ncbi:MAG TPA: hypothetical protein P5081_13090 [Phycisphaerae bacterium]|nr:hypothetical protein [Phycisphaerae bacterium]HRW53812.1 hypothetical protein [Phycisphaerae bacterium]
MRESNHGTSRIRRLIVLAALSLSVGLTMYKAAVAPITYDEAYTYLRFARRHTGEILSDYEYPNNHILHTLAVRASTRVFGDDAWAIRLPGALGGVALLAGVVALARRFREPIRTAWPVGVAMTPVVMEYNGLARGYSLGAAACVWAAWLIIVALEDAAAERPRSRAHGARLIAAGLLLGAALGCVPTFGLFVAGLLAATATIRFLAVRPVRFPAALADGALIVAGLAPVVFVVYSRVRLKPREWPWGLSDWPSCNHAFWEHTLAWPSLGATAALALSAIVVLATLTSLITARRAGMAERLLPLTLTFGVVTLGLAVSGLKTVWPLPRTIHWLAPLSLLVTLIFIRVVLRRQRLCDVVVFVLVSALAIRSVARWDSRRYAGWEDNAAIPTLVDAIEQDATTAGRRNITIRIPWTFDVLVDYALRRDARRDWRITTADDADADYAIVAANAGAPTGQTLVVDPSSGAKALRLK